MVITSISWDVTPITMDYGYLYIYIYEYPTKLLAFENSRELL